MEKIRRLVILILFAGTLLPVKGLWAGLNGFKKSMELEEKENREKEKPAPVRSEETNRSCWSACFSSFLELTWNITGRVWALHNQSVSFLPYPYAEHDRKNFIVYRDPDKPEEADQRLKNRFYALSLAYNSASENGAGAFLSFRGRFHKFIGPELEARTIWDKKNFLGYYALGLNTALIQTDIFIWDIYAQLALMRGILNRTGGSFGILLSSYPVKPLSLMLRFGLKHYQYIDFFDFEAKAGALIGPAELFFSYRPEKSRHALMENFITGIAWYF